MSGRRMLGGVVLSLGVCAALLTRAVTALSLGGKPLVYRVTVNNNDLEGIEGLGTPGRVIHLWARQRSFKEGNDATDDPFSWCAWKNGGNDTYVAWTGVDASGVFRMTQLRTRGTTVMMFPPAPAGDRCEGGLYTELRLQECDRVVGGNCTAPEVPKVNWLNVKRSAASVGTAAGSIRDAYQASIAVADGPNDGPEFSDVIDVDQNGFDTTKPGMTPGQLVTWKCGAGGTATCPSVAIYDSSTVVTPDPEYPFVLGTLQGHRPGGSVFAAAAIGRGEPLGFTVNINARFRGLLDVNIGCDEHKFFDFSVPFTF